MVGLAVDAEGVLTLKTEEVLRLVLAVADLAESTSSILDGFRLPVDKILIKVLQEVLVIFPCC